jgi:uncharacterized protein YjiS (DUF1127 family)
LEIAMSQTAAVPRSRSLLPRTRQSLANAAKRLETRQRIERELNALSDRALADIGLYRSDISEFATAASVSPASEPLLRALAADLRGLIRGRKTAGYTTRAAQ